MEVNGGRCIGRTNLPPTCADYLRKMGISNSRNPHGLSRSVQGLLYLLPVLLPLYSISYPVICSIQWRLLRRAAYNFWRSPCNFLHPFLFSLHLLGPNILQSPSFSHILLTLLSSYCWLPDTQFVTGRPSSNSGVLEMKTGRSGSFNGL